MSALVADLPDPVLVPLRAGTGEACVFLFPGAGGEAEELARLANGLTDPAPILGVQPALACPTPRTVEEMAVVAFAAMRARQPRGPYRLVGYSFGGLVALEVARLCGAAGQSVATLALIDTITDRRHWPTPILLGAQLHRLGVNLKTIAGLPPSAALGQFKDRAKGLWRQLARRRGGAESRAMPAGAPASTRAICDAAMADYRPTPFPDEICLLQSAVGRDFGCEPAALWRPLAERLQVRAVAGRHLDLVRSPAALASLSAALDTLLAEGKLGPDGGGRPKALLATSLNWLATTRLALALKAAGFEVEAVCPPGHSLGKITSAAGLRPYRALAAHQSLRDAIARSAPHIVIPCDDRVAAQLHQLAAADPAPSSPLQAIIARSLGAPEMFPRLYSRGAIMDLAGEAGVRRPETAALGDRGDLLTWLDRQGFPAVIKSDGSWGGSGVALVRDTAEASRAYDRLRAPPGLLRVVKRLVVNRDASLLEPFLRRRRAAVSVQAFVPGPPANAAVACFEGEVLAAVFAEVVCSKGATGPATVVHIVEHPEMAEAVTRMVRRLGLSGLCGFDFVLGPDGASLIELNPRATPTCHLTPAQGLDLPSALLAALQGRPAAPPDGRTRTGLVALFPQELMRDGQSPFLETAHHDVPWASPELVEEGLRMARRTQPRLRRLEGRPPGEIRTAAG